MKCKNCGGEVLENQQFCTNCGVKVDNQNTNTSELSANSNSLKEEVNENIPSLNPENEVQVNNDDNTLDNNQSDIKENNQVNILKMDENTMVNNNLSNENYMNSLSSQNNNVQNHVEEKTNVFLAILSFFIPLVGLVIFITKKKDEPKTAKASGICALISFILGFIIMIPVMIAIPVVLGTLEEITEEAEKITEEMNDQQDNDNYFENTNDGQENVDNNTQDVAVSNDWKKYEFSVNNQKIVLPSSYNDLANATGFSLSDNVLNDYIDKDRYAMPNMYKNNKLALYIELLNDTEGKKLYTDCKVTRVWQTKHQVDNGADVITFPGGITVNQQLTEQKLVELFGQPTKIDSYSDDGYESKTYIFNQDATWTTTNYYKIEIVNGVVDELVLDNR